MVWYHSPIFGNDGMVWYRPSLLSYSSVRPLECCVFSFAIPLSLFRNSSDSTIPVSLLNGMVWYHTPIFGNYGMVWYHSPIFGNDGMVLANTVPCVASLLSPNNPLVVSAQPLTGSRLRVLFALPIPCAMPNSMIPYSHNWQVWYGMVNLSSVAPEPRFCQ